LVVVVVVVVEDWWSSVHALHLLLLLLIRSRRWLRVRHCKRCLPPGLLSLHLFVSVSLTLLFTFFTAPF
jgi:hypothetical protein